MSLPRFVLIKSSYESCLSVEKIAENDKYGVLQFKGLDITNPRFKFAVEAAKVGSGLIHIRSCYNNKYLVRSSDPSSPSKGDDYGEIYITATAKDPEEDQSKWSCTLFKPIFVDDLRTNKDGADHDQEVDATFKIVKLVHVDQLGGHLILGKESRLMDRADLDTIPDKVDDEEAEEKQPQQLEENVFRIIDFSSIVQLPKRVVFKGDNGMYIRPREFPSSASGPAGTYLEFTGTGIWDPAVAHEVLTLSDGTIRIKSVSANRYWRLRSGWIYAEANEGNPNPNQELDSLFELIRLADFSVIFRNKERGFAGRKSLRDLPNCLGNVGGAIIRPARIEVQEPVILREITGVTYRLDDARIFDENITEMHSIEAVNTTRSEDTVEIVLRYTETRHSTWHAQIEANYGVTATFRAGIPIIASGTIQVSLDIQAEFEMEQTVETTRTWERSVTVPVPPMTKKTVSLVGTMGTCQVPFSYTQFDTLFDGSRVEVEYHGGLFEGINCYNLQVETSPEEPIEP